MEIQNIIWRGIEVEITFTLERFGMVDHIELRTDQRAPLPVTETGYRSNFIPVGTVETHGGAIAFVTDWLDHEAKRTKWSGAQMSLF